MLNVESSRFLLALSSQVSFTAGVIVVVGVVVVVVVVVAMKTSKFESSP